MRPILMSSKRSFRHRLTLTILILLFVTNGSLIIINYQIERQILIDQLRQRALLMGKTLQLNLAELILKSEHRDLASIPENERAEIREFIRHFGEEEVHLDMYSQNEGVHDLFFIDANNRVTIDYPAQKEGRILPAEEIIDASDISRMEHNEILSQLHARGADTILFLTFPVLRQQQLLGFGRIEMSMNSAVALINALQAMPDGGQIEVRASAPNSEKVEIVIRDTGCGIAPENLSKLFDPYFTTKVRGFGLGLSIVERIVQEHGGSIAVTSQPGKGAAFTITLPTCLTSESTELCTT